MDNRTESAPIELYKALLASHFRRNETREVKIRVIVACWSLRLTFLSGLRMRRLDSRALLQVCRALERCFCFTVFEDLC